MTTHHMYMKGFAMAVRSPTFVKLLFCGMVLLGILACLFPVSVVQAISATPPQAADSGASITIDGAVTSGRVFSACRVAEYGHVIVDNGQPTGVDITTVEGRSASTVIFTDGSHMSDLNFRQAVGNQIALIEDSLNGEEDAPEVSASGLVRGVDPLVWASQMWQAGLGSENQDPWFNAHNITTGPFRTLADWLQGLLDEDNDFKLPCATATGSRKSGEDVSTAFFSSEMAALEENAETGVSEGRIPGAGLYVVRDSHSDTIVSGTYVPAILIGTRIPVTGENGSTLYWDLYAEHGEDVRQRLGVLHVKGDPVTIKKVIDDPAKSLSPTFEINEIVRFRIETVIPHYDDFLRKDRNGVLLPVLFAVSDRHSIALSNIDGTGDNAGLADLTVTVGTTGLTYSDTCVVNSSNVDDACFKFWQGDANQRGENVWDVRIPSWVARTQGGQSMVLTYEQKVLPPISDADVVPASKDWNIARVHFSNNSYSEDYTNGDPDGKLAPSTSYQDERTYRDSAAFLSTGASLIQGRTEHSAVARRELRGVSVQPALELPDARNEVGNVSITSTHELDSLALAVFTFPLELAKIDSETSEPLADVHFSISAARNDDVPGVQNAKANKCFVRDTDGIYYPAGTVAPCVDGATETLRTGKDGLIRIKGLSGDRDYHVNETRQSAGYDISNVQMVSFDVRIEPFYNSETQPSEITGVEYLYQRVSASGKVGLPRYLANTQTVELSTLLNEGRRIRKVFSHRVTVLNGKTSVDVSRLARTGTDYFELLIAGLALALCGSVLMMVLIPRCGNRRLVQLGISSDAAAGSIAIQKFGDEETDGARILD